MSITFCGELKKFPSLNDMTVFGHAFGGSDDEVGDEFETRARIASCGEWVDPHNPSAAPEDLFDAEVEDDGCGEDEWDEFEVSSADAYVSDATLAHEEARVAEMEARHGDERIRVSFAGSVVKRKWAEATRMEKVEREIRNGWKHYVNRVGEANHRRKAIAKLSRDRTTIRRAKVRADMCPAIEVWGEAIVWLYLGLVAEPRPAR